MSGRPVDGVDDSKRESEYSVPSRRGNPRSADSLPKFATRPGRRCSSFASTPATRSESFRLGRDQGLSVLHRLQVTARSALGALALNCGGVVVDNGWLRILGGGSDGLADLATANNLASPSAISTAPPNLNVAYDVLGGQFAIDGGELQVARGGVCYFGPDTLKWAGLGVGHGDFVAWALRGGLNEFYSTLRWPGWQGEVRALRLDQGLSVQPFLFTREAHDPAACSRAPVPMKELLALHHDLAEQVSQLPEGSRFSVKIVKSEPRETIERYSAAVEEIGRAGTPGDTPLIPGARASYGDRSGWNLPRHIWGQGGSRVGLPAWLSRCKTGVPSGVVWCRCGSRPVRKGE
jgi:hypothetical protein